MGRTARGFFPRYPERYDAAEQEVGRSPLGRYWGKLEGLLGFSAWTTFPFSAGVGPSLLGAFRGWALGLTCSCFPGAQPFACLCRVKASLQGGHFAWRV